MSRFIWPVPYNLTQGFGSNPDYYAQYGQRGHNGYDLGAAPGTPVHASADGVVRFEGWGQNNSWMGSPAGICAIIDHGDVYTGYAHMQQTVVNAGQAVKQGDVIGYVGSTGAATGPHCHFEFIGKPPQFNNGFAGRIDPAQFNVGVDAPAPAPQGGDDMIDQATLAVLYRVMLGREPDSDALNHYVGHYATSFVVNDINASAERAQYAANQAAQVADLTSQLQGAQTERDSALAKLSQARTDASTAQTAMADLQSKLDAAEAQVADLQKQLDAAKQAQASAPGFTPSAPVGLPSPVQSAISVIVTFVKQVIGVSQ